MVDAVMNGQQFEESEGGGYNLSNKHYKKGELTFDGVDVPTGHNIAGGSPDELEARGISELSESYTNSRRGQPPKDIVPMAKIAYSMISRGHTREDFLAAAPKFYNPELLDIAWNTGESAQATNLFAKAIEDNLIEMPDDPEPLIEIEGELTTDELRQMPEFMTAARIVLTAINGEEFEGDDNDLFDAALDEMANFNWDPVTTARRGLKISNDSYPPEVAKAYGIMMQLYDATGTDWEIFKNSTWHGMTSLANLFSIMTLGGFALGKGGQIAAKKALMHVIQNKIAQAAAVTSAVGAVEGSAYGALDAAARKEIMSAGGWSVEDMPSAWQGGLAGAGAGAVLGGALGAALSQPAIKGYGQFIKKVHTNYQNAMLNRPVPGGPRSMRGSFSFKDIDSITDSITPSDQFVDGDIGIRTYDTARSSGFSRLEATIAEPKFGIIGKKGATGKQILDKLTKLRGSKDVFSEDELVDTGLDTFLAKNANERLTKDDLFDYLYANRYRVNAVIGEAPKTSKEALSVHTDSRTFLRKQIMDQVVDRMIPITKDDVTGMYQFQLREGGDILSYSTEDAARRGMERALQLDTFDTKELIEYMQDNDMKMMDTPARWSDMHLFNEKQVAAEQQAHDDFIMGNMPEPWEEEVADEALDVAEKWVDPTYEEIRLLVPSSQDSLNEIAIGRFGKSLDDLDEVELARANKISGYMEDAKPNQENQFHETIHFPLDVGRFSHMRVTQPVTEAGDDVILINELQSDMSRFTIHDSNYTKKSKGVKFSGSYHEASLTWLIQHAQKKGVNRIAIPSSIEQLQQIEGWPKRVSTDLYKKHKATFKSYKEGTLDPETDILTLDLINKEIENYEMQESVWRHYRKTIPKLMKKKFGDKVTVTTEKVAPKDAPPGIEPKEVTVFTFSDKLKGQPLNLNGFIATPGGAAAIGAQEKHSERDDKGRFKKK